MSKYLTTPIVDAISAANIFVDPAVWSKILLRPQGKKIKRDTNWLAIHLLSKILYWYKRTEVRDEITGKFLGYKKKFAHHMLQLGYKSIMEQMGCSYQEARDALACLLDAGMIHNPKGSINGRGNIMYIEPIVHNILCITNPKGVYEEKYLCLETQSVSVSGDTDRSVPGDTESTCTTSCTTSSKTTYDYKGDSSVDNSGQLPTSKTPPNNKKILKKEELDKIDNINKIKAMLRQSTNVLEMPKKYKTGAKYD